MTTIFATAAQRRADAMNGRTGELLRFIAGLAVAALVAYYTAIGAIREQVVMLDTREQQHFERLLEQITFLRLDVQALIERERSR